MPDPPIVFIYFFLFQKYEKKIRGAKEAADLPCCKLYYRRIGHAGSFTCRTVAPKLETQNEKEDQISTPHPQIMPNPRSFPKSGCRVFDFFEKKQKVILYGEVVIKNRYLEAKPSKFSPPNSLCGTVGSPWVSPATLFGFWETLIKFSESMILYGEKSFFRF